MSDKPKLSAGTVLLGGILILAGLLVLLDNMNILSLRFNIGDWWPLILIALGVLHIVDSRRLFDFSGLFLILLGGVFLAAELDAIRWDDVWLWWPAVLILLGVAMGLTSYLVDAEIPALVLDWTQRHIHSPLVFLLVMNAALLVLGSILEVYSAIIILAPLLVPMAPAYGIDPLHLGVIFLANVELGFLFPPMGLNLTLASTRFGKSLAHLYKVTWPFLLLRAAVVLAITYLPALSVGVLAKVKGERAPEVQAPVRP